MKKFSIVLVIILILSFALGACAKKTVQEAPPAGNETVQPAQPVKEEEPEITFDTSRNISVLTREDGSGTKTAFMELIGLKGKADIKNVLIQTSTAGILSEVEGNQTAIAYESLGYVTDAVKALTVEGVAATVDNIKNGSYKISRPLSIVYHESTLEDTLADSFFTFLQSSDAQELILTNGYVAIVDGVPAYTINASLEGEITISGSTSLQPLMIELAAAFEDLQPNVSIDVSGGGSGTGYQNAEEQVSVFGMISEEFNLEKAPSCVHTIVCKDGIAIIVNLDNPLNDISLEQLMNIYDEDAADNAITKWSELIN